MIIYGSSFSPFVRKVLAVATEKGIPFELKRIGLGSPDPDFVAASPFRKMPAIRDGDFTLADSTAIAVYLEAKHPDPALIPTEARERARCLWFDEFADTILQPVLAKVFFNRFVAPRFLKRPGDEAAAERAWTTEVPPLFDYLDAQLGEGGYLVGRRLTLADLSVACPILTVSHIDCRVDGGRHPRLAAFMAAMEARPGFATYLDKERRSLAR